MFTSYSRDITVGRVEIKAHPWVSLSLWSSLPLRSSLVFRRQKHLHLQTEDSSKDILHFIDTCHGSKQYIHALFSITLSQTNRSSCMTCSPNHDLRIPDDSVLFFFSVSRINCPVTKTPFAIKQTSLNLRASSFQFQVCYRHALIEYTFCKKSIQMFSYSRTHRVVRSFPWRSTTHVSNCSSRTGLWFHEYYS